MNIKLKEESREEEPLPSPVTNINFRFSCKFKHHYLSTLYVLVIQVGNGCSVFSTSRYIKNCIYSLEVLISFLGTFCELSLNNISDYCIRTINIITYLLLLLHIICFFYLVHWEVSFVSQDTMPPFSHSCISSAQWVIQSPVIVAESMIHRLM